MKREPARAMKFKAGKLVVSERDISKLIKDALEIYTKQGKLRYFRAHPIRLVTSRGRTFPVPVDESQKGISDFLVFLPAEVWFIETKKPGEKLRPEQEDWRRWAQDKPISWYFKVDSVSHAYQILDLLRTKTQ